MPWVLQDFASDNCLDLLFGTNRTFLSLSKTSALQFKSLGFQDSLFSLSGNSKGFFATQAKNLTLLYLNLVWQCLPPVPYAISSKWSNFHKELMYVCTCMGACKKYMLSLYIGVVFCHHKIGKILNKGNIIVYEVISRTVVFRLLKTF